MNRKSFDRLRQGASPAMAANMTNALKNPLPATHETSPIRPIPHPVAKRDKIPALDRAAPGEKEGVGRATVRFTGFRVRPLDPDNFAGSVKDLLDGLRHAGLIPGDEPWRIKLETEQVKVFSFKEERTEIEIEN